MYTYVATSPKDCHGTTQRLKTMLFCINDFVSQVKYCSNVVLILSRICNLNILVRERVR